MESPEVASDGGAWFAKPDNNQADKRSDDSCYTHRLDAAGLPITVPMRLRVLLSLPAHIPWDYN
jgi:hypothetical protein